MMCGHSLFTGVLGLMAAVMLARRLAWWRAAGACGHGRHGGHAERGARRMARWLFGHLETTPAQERVLWDDMVTVQEAARAAWSHRWALRQDAAAFFRGADAGPDAAARAVSSAEQRWETLRKAVRDGLQRAHEVLDDEQRERLARILEGRHHAPRGRHGRGGPRWM